MLLRAPRAGPITPRTMISRTLSSRIRPAWPRALIGALASLLVGAVLVWLALPISYPDWAGEGRALAPLKFSGEDFQPIFASAVLADVAAADMPVVEGRRFVLLTATRFAAENYPQLMIDLESLASGAAVVLFWRTAEQPDKVASVELQAASGGVSWHTLADHPAWTGSISSVALGAFGAMARERLELNEAVFRSATRRALVERSWAQWHQFDPWRMSSLNRYAGARGDVIVHPAAALSAWASASVLLFLAAAWRFRLPRRALIPGLLIVLFLPWIGLDRIWQLQLDRQLEATRDQFSGLSQDEKHRREMDAGLQRYAARLAQVLPADGDRRIFVLHDSKGHDYWRLRLQFHLLPRNVYNFGHELLPAGQMRPGDHVLLLDRIDGIRFDARRGELTDGQHRWRARLIDRQPFGSLFQLEEPDPKGDPGEAG